MLNDNTAGIDCLSCGFKEVTTNKADSESLQKSLQWTKNGDAICPECGNTVTYEDYINEQTKALRE